AHPGGQGLVVPRVRCGSSAWVSRVELAGYWTRGAGRIWLQVLLPMAPQRETWRKQNPDFVLVDERHRYAAVGRILHAQKPVRGAARQRAAAYSIYSQSGSGVSQKTNRRRGRCRSRFSCGADESAAAFSIVNLAWQMNRKPA